jgi:hypothetical protein
MYELTIDLGNNVQHSYKSESLPTLLREIASRFDSHDAQSVPLPFTTEVNHLGQILVMRLESKPKDPWWDQFHPRSDGMPGPLTATILRSGTHGALDGYPVPLALNKGAGKVWVAADRLGIVDVIYMARLPQGLEFEQYRDQSRATLEKKGRVLAGYITGDRFIPKLAEAPSRGEKKAQK